MFLMPMFRTGGGVLKANGNLRNLEVVVAADLFHIGVCASDLTQAAFFAHTRERENLSDT